MSLTSTLPQATTSRKAGFFATLATSLIAWQADRATLAAVEGLDAHLLRDIGFDVEPSADAVRRRLLIG